MDELELIKSVMKAFYDADSTDSLYWNFHGGTLNLLALCSDTFWWATADCEAIATEEDLALLQSCGEDLLAIERATTLDDNREDAIATCWFSSLYAARKRKMRPQRPVLRDLGPQVLALFEACGPERDE